VRNSSRSSVRGTPDFHEFSLQEQNHVLTVKIQEKFPPILGQREEKGNHLRLAQSGLFSLTKASSPRETWPAPFLSCGKGS